MSYWRWRDDCSNHRASMDSASPLIQDLVRRVPAFEAEAPLRLHDDVRQVRLPLGARPVRRAQRTVMHVEVM